MKFALLKLCFLATAATWVAPVAHAQVKMKYPAATFDADESKPTRTNNNTALQTSNAFNASSDAATPVVAQTAPAPAIEPSVATAEPVVAEPVVAAKPLVAEPVAVAATPVVTESAPTQTIAHTTDPVPTAAVVPTETPAAVPIAALPKYQPTPAPVAEPITIAASSYAAPLPATTQDSAPPASPSPQPRRATVDADGWPIIDDTKTTQGNSSSTRAASGTEDWPSEQYTPPGGSTESSSKSQRSSQKTTSSTRIKATTRTQPSSPSATASATLAAPVAASAPTASATPEATSPVNLSGSDSNSGINAKMTFRIQAGERMSDVFARWANATGWQMAWEPEDIIAMADLSLDDTLSGAIHKVIDALNRGGANIQARFYDANHVLRIMARK